MNTSSIQRIKLKSKSPIKENEVVKITISRRGKSTTKYGIINEVKDPFNNQEPTEFHYTIKVFDNHLRLCIDDNI